MGALLQISIRIAPIALIGCSECSLIALMASDSDADPLEAGWGPPDADIDSLTVSEDLSLIIRRCIINYKIYLS